MNGINYVRWLIGGFAAGALIWIIEGISSVSTMHVMQESLESHGLKMDVSPGIFAITIVVSLISGLVLVFFYVLARSRFGPGPKTAVLTGVAFWFGAVFTSLMGYRMIGLFPDLLLLHWGIVGLIEMILATLLGAIIYSEK